MNVDVVTSTNDDNSQGGGHFPPRTGLTSDALPEVQKLILAEDSKTGVSTRSVPTGTILFNRKNHISNELHWYALRTTYGREKKAYDFIISKGVTAFFPTLTLMKIVDGKRKKVEESRLPNIFFAYGTIQEIKSYVYDNVNLPYLRFYYRHSHYGKNIIREPLIVPDNQIETLRIICKAEADDVVMSCDEIVKFKEGQLVRIIDGKFKGVVGTIARYKGQQRVGIVIDRLLTVATAYIPTAFIEPMQLQ